MRVYIMTDMEGCAGIVNHDDWVLGTGCHYALGREILTREVNAAIEGFLEGGATDLLVVDGHGAGGIDPGILNPAARLAAGVPSPVYPFFLDHGPFDAMAWVGQHAKAGTDGSHLTHTQWFNWIDFTINGISVGEYGEMALCGMELGIPSIFGAGEEAFCAEAEALTPGIVTVGVKRGVCRDGLDHLSEEEYRRAKLGAIHLSPAMARDRIRAGALEAIRKFRKAPGSFTYPLLRKPYVMTRRLRTGHGTPPKDQWATHPDRIIGLLNSPWQDGLPPA